MTIEPPKVNDLQRRIEQQANRRGVKKFLDLAVKYGVIKRGWSACDYMREAVENYGWESTGITGPKGTAKSNLLLQRGFSIYGDWDLVRQHTITEMSPFLEILEGAIEANERIPWLGVDDIATIFPRSLYFTDRKLYSELKSSWETTRTTISNFDWTATRKNKVATFITDDITGDVITYKRERDIIAHYDYQRWLWLRNLDDPTEMIAKPVAVEDIPFPLIPEAFQIDKVLREGEFISGGKTYTGEAFFKKRARLLGVPRPEFVKYWDNRLGLAKTAYQRFRKTIAETQHKADRKLSQSEGGEVGAIRKKIKDGTASLDDYRRYAQLSDKRLNLA